VLDAVADPARRREIAEQATETATGIATDVAKKSADVGARVGEKISEVAHAVRTSDAADRIATDVAKRTADLSSQAGERMSDVAHVLTEEGRAVMEQHRKDRKAKKPRKHRLRNSAVLVGAGAAVAYFLDPQNGRDRREAAKRKTSTSAQTVGDSLDKAAQVAHQTAEATAPDPAGVADPSFSRKL